MAVKYTPLEYTSDDDIRGLKEIVDEAIAIIRSDEWAVVRIHTDTFVRMVEANRMIQAAFGDKFVFGECCLSDKEYVEHIQ